MWTQFRLSSLWKGVSSFFHPKEVSQTSCAHPGYTSFLGHTLTERNQGKPFQRGLVRVERASSKVWKCLGGCESGLERTSSRQLGLGPSSQKGLRVFSSGAVSSTTPHLPITGESFRSAVSASEEVKSIPKQTIIPGSKIKGKKQFFRVCRGGKTLPKLLVTLSSFCLYTKGK